MSKKELDTELVPNEYNVIKVTDRNRHLIDKDILEAADYITSEMKKGRIFFPKKYLPAQKDMLLRKTKELHETTPDLPLKNVIIKIMEKLPDFLPADNLVEVTKIITSTWEELRQKVAA